MAKVWVLDTDTKGTGANMVPLERVVKERTSAAREPSFAFEKVDASPPSPPAAKEPLEFRVVDVMTREVLADHADARAAVGALEGRRSVADVSVYVWDPKDGRWRMLTIGETRALWAFRGRGAG